jgi:[Skp1-protein]-hydroxyproline N-acetylglucosaminyltransferase
LTPLCLSHTKIGVVDQLEEGDPACNEPIEPCDKNPKQALCMYNDRVDVFRMKADLSVGPVFARHIGHRIYRGEYYTTQSDAHVTYTQDWDADIISQMEATKNDMAVLTSYLTDVQDSIDENGKSLRDTRPIMCNTDYEGGQGQHLRHGSQPERVPSVVGTPQLEPYWAAGYSFSRGHFVVNVPYDALQPMIFQGEEMSIGIRAFTIGYDMYAPERSVCFHHYAVGNNARTRNKVPHFWENAKSYPGVGKKAMSRLLGIVHMNPEVELKDWDHTDENLYGIGGVRTPEKFYETFGIDVVKKKTEHHLCRFVDWGGKMHKDFNIFLRPDGMGVDYSKITYRFKDPAPGEK